MLPACMESGHHGRTRGVHLYLSRDRNPELDRCPDVHYNEAFITGLKIPPSDL